ncbi:GDYXXLXY domain-containing protein [Campylobacter blaseri]|nr:GDYXXLXY domain-containing protein [Campylobacter blaseri]QKF86072.1 GDYXXLXY domain-containing protein [Campylobacter blaseri]
MRKFILFGIIFQISILFSFVAFAYAPLYFGEEIKVKASGFDPRDIFLGNYVYLRYEGLNQIQTEEEFKRGKKVYLILEKEKDLYKGKKVTHKKPKDEVFITGRVTYQDSVLNIKFGIEKYFLPQKDALKLEKQLQSKDAVVTLGVLNGLVRIKKFEFE